MLCNWVAFIPAFAITDEKGLIWQADEQNFEGPQVTDGGRHQSYKCSHTHTYTCTSQCVNPKKKK